MRSDSTSLLLVDTNILVYIQDLTEPTKQAQASALVGNLLADGRAGASVQVLGEFFNTVTRKLAYPLTADEGLERVRSIAATFKILEVTLASVLEAIGGCTRHQMSYWDALIWAVAKQNYVPVVLTEDVRGRPTIEGVRFINPFDPAFDLARL